MDQDNIDFVISDDILSPDDESRGLCAQQKVDFSLLSESVSANVAGSTSARSLENIILDTSPMEESIDLGSESILTEQACHTVESSLLPADGSRNGDEIFGNSVDVSITVDSTESRADIKQVHFTDLVVAADNDSNELAGDVSLAPETHTVPDNIENTNMEVTLTKLTSDSEAVEIVTESAGDGKHIVAVEEATKVEFVEEKGIHTAASSRSLSKFFMDSSETAGGTDTEGKSFFDSFTAGEIECASSVTLGASPQVVEQPPFSGSAVGLTTPPTSLTGPVSAGIVNSPTRRISDTNSPAFQFQLSLNREVSIGSVSSEVDPFSSGIFSNDNSRRHDAWIPSVVTSQVLMSVIAASGSSLPVHQSTRPCVILEETLGDPVRDTVQRYFGEQEAAKRLVLNADSVPQDEVGLQQLIKADCLRAAVDLTGRLLTMCDQGPGSMNLPMKHTPFSLQLWFCRLALLVKLRLYSSAEAEIDQFGDLDSPDLYHEYHMQLSGPIRHGSMVPFDFRLLHAELPQYLGKPHESLDRLHRLLTVIKQMLTNLKNGLAEDGSMLELNDESRQASLDLWSSRQVKVLYGLGNSLLNMKDYVAAMEIYRTLLEKDEAKKSGLYRGIGRIYLQLGDVNMAAKYFDLANASTNGDDLAKNQERVHCGLLHLCGDNFKEAYEVFKQVIESEPTNVIAVNNLAVCSLYLGRLKEALRLLEDLVYSDPVHHLQEGILLNLCTLYELESSRAMIKKQSLLSLVNQYRGNGFNITCLKLS